MYGNIKKDIKDKLTSLYRICKAKKTILTPGRFNLAAALFQYGSCDVAMAYDIIADYKGDGRYSIPGELEAFLASVQAA